MKAPLRMRSRLSRTLDLFGFSSKCYVSKVINILENPDSLSVLENWHFSSKRRCLEKPWRAKATKKVRCLARFLHFTAKNNNKRRIQTRHWPVWLACAGGEPKRRRAGRHVKPAHNFLHLVHYSLSFFYRYWLSYLRFTLYHIQNNNLNI
jgi:hypothetical protein